METPSQMQTLSVLVKMVHIARLNHDKPKMYTELPEKYKSGRKTNKLKHKE